MRSSILIFALLIVLSCCTHTPDGVLSEGDMTDLLVDIHKGEAYIDAHSDKYSNDSLKKLVKQSVFAQHKVTQAEFDSSLIWYGHHIDEYVKVYENVIKNLNAQDKNLMAKAKDQGQDALATGDSVDMWNKSKVEILSKKLNDGILTFDFKADNGFKKGDRYNWAFRVFNKPENIKVFLGVDYKDGSTSFNTQQFLDDGWTKVSLQTDSAKEVKRIYGVTTFSNIQDKDAIFVDSVQLVRTRLYKPVYYRFDMQKSLKTNKSRSQQAKK